MRLMPFGGFSFGKMWKNVEQLLFSGRLQLDLGDTAPAAMAGLMFVWLRLITTCIAHENTLAQWMEECFNSRYSNSLIFSHKVP